MKSGRKSIAEQLANPLRPVSPCPFCGDKIVRYEAPEFVGHCARCGRVLPLVQARETADV